MNLYIKTICVSAVLLAVVTFGVKPAAVAAATAYPLESDRPFEDPSIVRHGDRDSIFDEYGGPSSFDFQHQRTADEGFERDDQSSSVRDQVYDVLSEIFREPFDVFSVHLYDGSYGWEPDGNATTFVIDEPEVHPDFSTVIVNTIQGNFVICAVDYLWNEAFEVNCNLPPADGAQLKYTVINMDPIEVGYPIADELAERYENLTEGVIVGLSPLTNQSIGRESDDRTDSFYSDMTDR